MRIRSVIVHLVLLAACSTDDSASSPSPDASVPNDSGPPVDTGAPSSDASSAADADAAVDATPSGYAASVLSDAPVAYWRFGETSGTTAKNAAPTGTAYDLTLSAGFTVNDLGKPGLIANEPGDHAFFFNGSANAAVPFGASTPGLAATNAFTVEAWVRIASALDGGAGATVFGTKDPSATNGFIFFVQASGKLGMPCPTIGFYSGNTVTVPFDDQPHHVAVVWEGTGSSATFYVDGNSETIAGAASRSIIYTSSTANVGAPPGSAGSFVGVLDEVAFYDKALPVARLIAHRSAAQ